MKISIKIIMTSLSKGLEKLEKIIFSPPLSALDAYDEEEIKEMGKIRLEDGDEASILKPATIDDDKIIFVTKKVDDITIKGDIVLLLMGTGYFEKELRDLFVLIKYGIGKLERKIKHDMDSRYSNKLINDQYLLTVSKVKFSADDEYKSLEIICSITITDESALRPPMARKKGGKKYEEVKEKTKVGKKEL